MAADVVDCFFGLVTGCNFYQFCRTGALAQAILPIGPSTIEFAAYDVQIQKPRILMTTSTPNS